MNRLSIQTETDVPPCPAIQGDVPWQEALMTCIAQLSNERARVSDQGLPVGKDKKRLSIRSKIAQIKAGAIKKNQALKHRSHPSHLPPAIPEAARRLEDDHSIAIPFNFKRISSTPKIGIVAHIFYPEIAHELRQLLVSMPDGFNLYISTCSENSRHAIDSILSNYPPIPYEIRVVENRGRDIISKTTTFTDVFDKYDLLLFLHSKRSKHSSLLQMWRHYLFETLAGSKEIVESIMTMFEESPSLGIVAPQHFEPMRQFVNWGGNYFNTKHLLEKLGQEIPKKRWTDFPSGSMFWARPAALAAMRRLNIKMDDYPAENNQKDGTLAHAVEHAFYYLCEISGFQWLKVAVPAYCTETPAILIPQSADDLVKKMAHADSRLLSSSQDMEIRKPLPVHIRQPTPALKERIIGRAAGKGCNKKSIAIGIIMHNSDEHQASQCLRAVRIAINRSKLIKRYGIHILTHDALSTIKNDTVHNIFRSDKIVSTGAGHNQMMQATLVEQGYDAYLALQPDGVLHPEALDHMIASAYAAEADALVEALHFPREQLVSYDEYTFNVECVSAACTLITKKIYQATLGFDEQLSIGYEDIDFSWRARAAGINLKICPQALILRTDTCHQYNHAAIENQLTYADIFAKKWHLDPLNDQFKPWLAGTEFHY